ncbi:NHL repeat-containing protein [Desulfurobacterium atlanticum]|uniref:NHL repeat-containing protein n=1 Tax=Desulfurobacterium atlanticum TaxID=240169 RepID=A0A239A8J3_9BACT|nr:NHL repeat-containing protein [Desulfurobacterium atlanticum]SNR91641.1 hypothetical protein SAMN06265340_11620 [Desulfurobacterium atlanticum]
MRFLMLSLLMMVSLISSAFAGEIKGNFKFPSDIAVKKGNIFVVDGLNNRVVKLNEDGDVVSTFAVKKPYGIYVSDEKIYLSTTDGNILILDFSGNVLKKFNVGGRLVDLVVLGGKIWVVDASNDCVKIISEDDGNLVKIVGEKGSTPGEFVSPFMIATDGDEVYVVDSINARVQVFNKKGEFERTFGEFGIEEGDLFRPKGIAVFNGEVAVSDVITGAVQLFNPYGAFDGVVAKGLQYPMAIAYEKGVIYVLEPLKNKILTFKVQGVK